MYACKICHDRDQLSLQPTFGTLATACLLLTIPFCGLMLGLLTWIQLDSMREIAVPAFVPVLLLGLCILAELFLIGSTCQAPFPVRIHRSSGIQIGRRHVAMSEVQAVVISADESSDAGDHYHLMLELRSGESLELRRTMWSAESNHGTAWCAGREVASFLNLPLRDQSPGFETRGN